MGVWKRAKPRSGRSGVPLRPGPVARAAVALVSLLVALGPARPLHAGTRPAAEQCGAALRVTEQAPGALPNESGEASGVVASPTHPGVVWMIRDSGHPASLYALRFEPDGKATSREIPVEGATNKDWEDVTAVVGADGNARLWITESGQGGSGGRVIYEVPEPDPGTATSVRASARYPYAYPDQTTNTEAAFTWGDDLVLVTKNFPARAYRFDELVAGRVNEPAFVGELTDSNGISVARPSPDGRFLVTATHNTVAVYRNADTAGALEGFMGREPSHFLEASPGDNVEAGAWTPLGACELLLVSEQRNTYRLTTEPR